MQASRIPGFILLVFILLIVIASLPEDRVSAQGCYDPQTQQPIPCPASPEKKKRRTKTPTFVPSTRTFTPTPTGTSTRTPTLTPSPTLVPEVKLTCDATPKTGTAPLTVKFVSSPGGGTRVYGFDWVFGKSGSARSAEQNPTFVYNDPGTYSAVVHVSSPPQDPSNPQPGTFADCRIAIIVTEPTPTPTPTATPFLGLSFLKSSEPDTPGLVWPINIYSGMGIALIGILISIVRRPNLGSGYISTHEIGHAQLNSTDEYIESGLGKGLHIARFGLIAGGGVMAIAGGLGNFGILPCSWWPIAVGISAVTGVGISLPGIGSWLDESGTRSLKENAEPEDVEGLQNQARSKLQDLVDSMTEAPRDPSKSLIPDAEPDDVGGLQKTIRSTIQDLTDELGESGETDESQTDPNDDE